MPMKNCVRCGLPEAVPMLNLDNTGICRFCRKEQEEKQQNKGYFGIERLKQVVEERLSNADQSGKPREYDCVVSFSGGRDSVYLLYLVKKILGLNPLAVASVNGFMPNATRENLVQIAEKLSVKLVQLENTSLDRVAPLTIRAWAKKPTPEMLLGFCTGCRIGINNTVPQYAKDHNIPVVFTGHVPHESLDYRLALLNIDKEHPSGLGMILGYLKQIGYNPRYLLHMDCMMTQAQEVLSSRKWTAREGSLVLWPFYNYIEYSEAEAEHILKELDWKIEDGFTAARRSDCYIGYIRQYYYGKLLGYNDLDFYLASLVRKGEITLEESKIRREKEGFGNYAFVKNIMKRYFDCDADEVEKKIDQK